MSDSICIVLPDLRGGGAERVNIDLAHEFVRAGHNVEIVLMFARGELLSEARASFPVVDLGTPRVRSLMFPLVRYLRQRRPDALLAAMWPLTVIAPLAQCLSGQRCRVLVSEHGILSAQYRDRGRLHHVAMRLSMALGYRVAGARVGVSGGVADDIASLSGLPRRAVTVIHNPVPLRPEPDAVAMADADSLWSGPHGARIVTAGAMKPVKNHLLLLQAFARLDRPDARLMFVGDGAGRVALQASSWDLGIADRVVFVGFRPDPTAFYRTADLFVLSSDYEGFGNVIVEAMSCGTPVVSTDCPSGPGEILEGGRYGLLVPVGDVSALARAMEETLGNPPDPGLLRSRAEDFAPAKAANAYLKVLSEH